MGYKHLTLYSAIYFYITCWKMFEYFFNFDFQEENIAQIPVVAYNYAPVVAAPVVPLASQVKRLPCYIFM